ncbi:MAG: hypothetical protein LUE98_12835 [Tannerellaceae bacterium]|nr:hypothetical protein [Tannerellaceae bacterium]
MESKKKLHTGGSNITKRQGANEQAENLLKSIKEKTGEVILVAITPRTTIELPASLTQVEIDAHIANYMRLRTSKV